VDNINLMGLDHALVFTAVADKVCRPAPCLCRLLTVAAAHFQVLLRSYRIVLKKSGTRLPR
jgi:hypothetical protein